MLVWDCAISVIGSLQGFAICGESLNLEPKYGRIVARTLLDAASTMRP